MNILIHNATILPMNNKKMLHQAAVAIENQKIVDVGKTRNWRESMEGDTKRSMSQTKLLFPALSTHTSMLP
jgi:predicted amidohydrolase YtcJ